MPLKPTLFLTVIVLPLLFLEETLAVIRRLRQWLEDDIRRRVRQRVSDEKWAVLEQELDREFAD